MDIIKRYDHCFICGNKNDIGLNVDFYDDGGIAKAEYICQREFEGYRDILHGGIIASLLDEVMIKAIIAKGILSVTYNMDITFKKPAQIGETIFLEGKIVEDKLKIIITEGKAFKENGEIVAIATGKYFKVEGKMKEMLEQSIE